VNVCLTNQKSVTFWTSPSTRARHPPAAELAVTQASDGGDPVGLDVSVLAGSPPPVEVELPPDFSASLVFVVDGLVLRSFLAQPDPLKWTAGADKALRSGAPQTGQLAGPGSFTPWMTSVV